MRSSAAETLNFECKIPFVCIWPVVSISSAFSPAALKLTYIIRSLHTT